MIYFYNLISCFKYFGGYCRMVIMQGTAPCLKDTVLFRIFYEQTHSSPRGKIQSWLLTEATNLFSHFLISELIFRQYGSKILTNFCKRLFTEIVFFDPYRQYIIIHLNQHVSVEINICCAMNKDEK